MLLTAQKNLRKKANKTSARLAARFFKTGPGEYGAGDIFLGGTSTPELTLLAKQNLSLSFKEIRQLLSSKFHEERALGLKVLVFQYQKIPDLSGKTRLVNFYLKNKLALNNWDLVDMSAYKILGDYCHTLQNTDLIDSLSNSSRHWDKRMAIVASFAFIRHQQLSLTFTLSKKFLNETEDLMHKACGWMLREAGKRDKQQLQAFISSYGKIMPRTMLRYAIEKFSTSERRRILKSTKN